MNTVRANTMIDLFDLFELLNNRLRIRNAQYLLMLQRGVMSSGGDIPQIFLDLFVDIPYLVIQNLSSITDFNYESNITIDLVIDSYMDALADSLNEYAAMVIEEAIKESLQKNSMDHDDVVLYEDKAVTIIDGIVEETITIAHTLVYKVIQTVRQIYRSKLNKTPPPNIFDVVESICIHRLSTNDTDGVVEVELIDANNSGRISGDNDIRILPEGI